MLRITDEMNAEITTLHLEGRLVNDWVELLCANIARHDAASLVLDLSGVSYASQPGIALLIESEQRGVMLHHGSFFLQEMIRQARLTISPGPAEQLVFTA